MKPTSKTMMDERRVRVMVEAYGAHSARWPSDERQDAETLLARSPELARWVAEQCQLDVQLNALGSIEPSRDLMRRVAEIPLRHPATDSSRVAWAWPWWRRMVAMGMAAAALGIAVGLGSANRRNPLVEIETGLDLDASAWNDLAELGLAADLDEDLSP